MEENLLFASFLEQSHQTSFLGAARNSSVGGTLGFCSSPDPALLAIPVVRTGSCSGRIMGFLRSRVAGTQGSVCWRRGWGRNSDSLVLRPALACLASWASSRKAFPSGEVTPCGLRLGFLGWHFSFSGCRPAICVLDAEQMWTSSQRPDSGP